MPRHEPDNTTAGAPPQTFAALTMATPLGSFEHDCASLEEGAARAIKDVTARVAKVVVILCIGAPT